MRSFMGLWLRRLAGTTVIVLLLAAGIGWWQRELLLAWYAVRGLSAASENERAAWIERVAAHEHSAVPMLLSQLRRSDASGCGNVRICLQELARHWPAEDSRHQLLSQGLARDFAAFSLEGRKAALELCQAYGESGRAERAGPLAALVSQAAGTSDAEVHDRALTLAMHMTRQQPPPAVVLACRELARVCLRDESADIRVRALRLAIQPRIDLRDQVVPLLHDSASEIRRAVMMVVGPAEDIMATDDLLRWLHDPDPDVRRLCEGALKGRGLQEEHLKMGKLLTDSRAAERLKVLAAIREVLNSNTDLEPGVWLRRLSHDPVPAVRAATVRMAAEQTLVDLSDRLEQMSQDDPSPTIRQLARYYLSCRKR